MSDKWWVAVILSAAISFTCIMVAVAYSEVVVKSMCYQSGGRIAHGDCVPRVCP